MSLSPSKSHCRLELFSWGPGMDRPSFDPHCLSLQAYLQMAQADWMVNYCNNPSMSLSGELPFIRDGFEVISGSTTSLFEYLCKKGLDLDWHLTAVQQADCKAYTALIEEKLYDALLYNRWLETENYLSSTRPVFSKALPWLLKYRMPSHLLEKAKSRLSHYRKIKVDDAYIPEVYMNARRIYKQLAIKLGDQDYFYGSRPCSLDAVAYAHLSLHAFPSLSQPKLFAMLSFEFPTLIAYCHRIHSTLFSSPPTPSPTDRKSIRNSILTVLSSPLTSLEQWWTGSTKNPINKSREQRIEDFYRVCSIVGGLGFFVGYVVYNGIVRIETREEEEEELEYYQEETDDFDD